jgi:hypothetical protein
MTTLGTWRETLLSALLYVGSSGLAFSLLPMDGLEFLLLPAYALYFSLLPAVGSERTTRLRVGCAARDHEFPIGRAVAHQSQFLYVVKERKKRLACLRSGLPAIWSSRVAFSLPPVT